MARTHGHGNPDWTQEETILALNVYLECGGVVPTKSDPRVVALSALLQAAAYHAQDTRKASFRNVDGVTFKMHNLRSVSTGKGLSNTSAMDRSVWTEFGDKPSIVAELAAKLRADIEQSS